MSQLEQLVEECGDRHGIPRHKAEEIIALLNRATDAELQAIVDRAVPFLWLPAQCRLETRKKIMRHYHEPGQSRRA